MSKRATRLTGLFVAVAVFIGLNLPAQQTNVGGITGTVRDASGAVIAGAAVEAVNQGTTRSADEIKGLPIAMQGVATRGAIAVVQSLAGVNADTGGQNQVWTVISRAAINGVMPGEVGYQIDGVPAGMGESESAEDF